MVLSEIEKNRLGLEQGINHKYWFDSNTALEKAVEKVKDEWLPILFDLCEKIGVAPEKDRFKRLIRRCQSDKTGHDSKNFNKYREKMFDVLKQNFPKFYPNEEIPIIKKENE